MYVNVEGDVTEAVLARLRSAVPDLKNLWHVKP